MPKETGECPCPRIIAETDSSVAGLKSISEDSIAPRLEMSGEAVRLLRNAAIPSEFLEISSDFIVPADLLPRRFAASGDARNPMLESSEPRQWNGFTWPEAGQGAQVEVGDRPETLVETLEDLSSVSLPTAFRLTELTLNMSGVAHSTPGLAEWADIALDRIVTNTYPVLLLKDDQLEIPGEVRDADGEEIPKAPCVFCRLILIFGPSQRFNGSENRYEVTDSAIQAAHDAAALHFAAHKDECLRVIHAGWRTGDPNAGRVHRFPGSQGGWQGTSADSTIKNWLNAPDPAGKPIDCYSHVLVIYHGETQQRTVDMLKWLARYCRIPIRHLYLWSCWGSEKIDPADPDVKKGLAGVQDIEGSHGQEIEKQKKDLESKAEKLRKELQKPKPKKPEKLKKELGELNEQIKRLTDRRECDCRLCVYTAAPLDVKEAKDRLEAEIQRLENAGAPKDEKKRVKKAREKVEKAKKDQYAVPLGLKDTTAANNKMVLLAPETTMLVYCPLDLNNPAPVEKAIDEIEFFPDVPVEQDTDLVVRGLLR